MRTASAAAWDPRSAPTCSLIVPAFNEAARLPTSLPVLADLAADGGHELIVVDDGSTDGTVETAQTLLRGVPGAAVIRLPKHRGKGAAVRAGVARAGADAIVFLDADLATDPADLPVLLAALDHAHIAIGSRAIAGSQTVESTPLRVHAGRLFNTTVRTLTRLPLLDTQCGFKAFRHHVAKLLFGLQRVDGLAFDVELLALARRFGFSVIEVPVHWRQMPGSRIRAVADPALMAVDVARTSWRWRPHGRALSTIQAVGRDDQDASAAVAALHQHLGSRAVAPWGPGALALLPFVQPRAAHAIAGSVQRRLPEFDVVAGNVAPAQLLGPEFRVVLEALAVA